MEQEVGDLGKAIEEVDQEIAEVEGHEKEVARQIEHLAKEEARLEAKMKAEVLSGKLVIILEKAELFIDTETFGKMDPFTVFTQEQVEGIAPAVYKSKVLDGAGKKPVWNEEFTLSITNIDMELNVHIWEEDVGSNDDLGQFTITPRTFSKADCPTQFRCFI
jgi:hypothetical protein